MKIFSPRGKSAEYLDRIRTSEQRIQQIISKSSFKDNQTLENSKDSLISLKKYIKKKVEKKYSDWKKNMEDFLGNESQQMKVRLRKESNFLIRPPSAHSIIPNQSSHHLSRRICLRDKSLSRIPKISQSKSPKLKKVLILSPANKSSKIRDFSRNRMWKP